MVGQEFYGLNGNALWFNVYICTFPNFHSSTVKMIVNKDSQEKFLKYGFHYSGNMI